jgi:hypothetical protein
MYCEWQALNEIPVGRRLEEVTPLQRRRETWGSGLGEPGERNLGERAGGAGGAKPGGAKPGGAKPGGALGERWGSRGSGAGEPHLECHASSLLWMQVTAPPDGLQQLRSLAPGR